VKIIRNKQTGHSEGYGFIEFSSRAAAEHTLMNFNGQMMPNVEMTFKLNWASASTGDKRGDSGSDHTIFVGDLAHGVTDSMLEDVFRAKYPSVRGANVVVDRMTGWPKGYGLVRFGDLNNALWRYTFVLIWSEKGTTFRYSIIGYEDERSVLRNLFMNALFDLSLCMLAPQCIKC
jgi:RNA recognition motif-containing protein